MRENVLRMQIPGPPVEGVRLVLMDWIVGNGTASVLATFDGTASVYLSSGGGFIGGGQRHPEIAEAAKSAVKLAQELLPAAMKSDAKVDAFELPQGDSVYFYLRTNDAVFLAIAKEQAMAAGSDPLTPLGGAMQAIVTGYRLARQQASSK